MEPFSDELLEVLRGPDPLSAIGFDSNPPVIGFESEPEGLQQARDEVAPDPGAPATVLPAVLSRRTLARTATGALAVIWAANAIAVADRTSRRFCHNRFEPIPIPAPIAGASATV